MCLISSSLHPGEQASARWRREAPLSTSSTPQTQQEDLHQGSTSHISVSRCLCGLIIRVKGQLESQADRFTVSLSDRSSGRRANQPEDVADR